MEGSKRFDYVKYDEAANKKQAEAKTLFVALEGWIERNLSPGRAKALVLTKFEESYMWIGKAIRDEQIEQGRPAPLQEERGKE